MPLSAGARLGPYEILGTIGAGAMGEVYRARDTNLQRDVAIKVLPDSMARNPSRLLRFEREARTLAALNHPNIAAVYAIEERAIVMELVLGEDLSVRIKRGPIPPGEALPIARQVAEALAAAHDAGIVHRDLKPANIKVSDDGAVKVLDFGLAKGVVSPMADSESSSGSGSESGDLPPTLTMDPDITAAGAVMGTAAYMAPEQAKGKTIDKRADIWAFGVVLFEMLAGCRPFGKGDASETLARALTAEPEWAALPQDTPASIRRLLIRCLTKDRRARLHDIADARLDIDDAMAPENVVAYRTPWVRAGALIVVGLLGGVVVGRSLWQPSASSVPAVTYARLDVNPAAEVDAGGIHPSVVLTPGGARTALAWSPDGRTLAFIGVKDGVRQIYVRRLDGDSARPVAGTERAGSFAFSPDGSEVSFWADRALQRVRTSGGPVVKICDTGEVNGITWAAGRLVFSQGSLWSIDLTSAAAVPTAVIVPPELVRHASPFLLPGARALLYTEYQKQWTSGDERVMLLPLEPGASASVLIREAADARYLSTGHLAFMRQGTLFVVPFDLATLTLRGEPVALLKDVSQSSVAWDSADLTLAGQFAISSQGTLAYIRSPLATYPGLELVTFDRRGRITPLNAPIKGYRNHVEVSPDGSQLAVSLQTATDLQLFSYDLVRGGLSRIAESMKGEVILASWARDNRIAVGVINEGRISAAVVRPDGAAIPTPVADSTGFWPSSLLPDGRLAGMKDGGIWVYRVEPGPKPVPFLSTPATFVQPMWSPDGRWLAYTSDATGRNEVYVRSYPGPGDAIMISTQGGSSPAWNPSGRELFYVQPGPPDRMMAVRLSAPGRPVGTDALFSIAPGDLVFGAATFTPYAVAPDGQRFYASRRPSRSSTPADAVQVIFNWFEEIK